MTVTLGLGLALGDHGQAPPLAWLRLSASFQTTERYQIKTKG